MSEPILFRPGEKAVFTRPEGVLTVKGDCGFDYGAILTIISISPHISKTGWRGPWYDFQEGPGVVVCHQALRRIDPIHDAAGSWKDCIWKPKEKQKQISHEPIQV